MPNQPAGRTTSGFAPRARPIILVVEDHEDTRELYADFLAHSGFTVLEAADGADAIDKALRFHPAALVLDLSLPGIDGFRVVRRLRADERTHDMPVVALSANAGPIWGVLARNAGCDVYLAKPCLPSALLAQLRALLVVRAASGSGNDGGAATC